EGPGHPPETGGTEPGLIHDGALKPFPDETSLKRLVFRRVPLELTDQVPTTRAPIKLSQGESVIFFSPDKPAEPDKNGDRDDGIVKNIGDIFRQDYGVATLPMLFVKEKDEEPVKSRHTREGRYPWTLPLPKKNGFPIKNLGNDGLKKTFHDNGQEGYDIFSDEGSYKVSERMSGLASLAGMVITLPEGWSKKLKGIEDVSRLLRGMLLPLKAFLRSPARKFVLLIHSRADAETHGRLLVEGMLGLFLSAAQEYPSVQFRTVEIGGEIGRDLRVALRSALDRGCPVVEMMHRDGRVFTSEGHVAPSVFGDSSGLVLSPGDVIVMSGGATGISAHLARCLLPFMPRLVFLGRTPLDPGINSIFDSRASEIARTLADLHSSGIEATYHVCDVTDPEAVRATMSEVAGRYGRIDGIIHGAGVLRDGLLSQMTPNDFSMVTDVKFLGAWNLFSAAEGAGLRFFVGLSSAAAIQGNPGQANYAAANRMMSALLRTLHRKNSAIRCKALMLPPVEGAGMAEDPEVRELLKLKGVAYIHVNELAGLFCRELFVAPDDDDWVMFMRSLPSVKTALLSVNDTTRPSLSGELDGGTVSLSPGDFPMIERVSCLDLRREELEAFRSFSLEKDLWIADHRPFKFVKHPLVSAAMVLETFMEASRILYPHLQVRGVRHVRLMDMIQCPPGVPRPSRITCRRTGNDLREMLCEVSLSTREISPAGRLTDRFIPHCSGQVVLAGGDIIDGYLGDGYPGVGSIGHMGEGLPDFPPVRLDELHTKPMDHKKVLAWYKDRSGLEGRYRVMESLDGAGQGVVRGRTTCRETRDFADLRHTRYQYSPYLFEALLQLVVFQVAATDPSERRSMIPFEIGEMRFVRKCLSGEQITLEARIRAQNDEGLSWDARGIDDQGRTIMQIYGIRMHWVSD
ncbi:MAG: SDR family oxidoreductase, partial [Thermodesulfovibrionales bacterium]